MIFWNVSRNLFKQKFTRRLPASRMDHCLESKSTKLLILQILSSWESLCCIYLRENQENDYSNTLNVIVQPAKNYATIFSKFLKSLFSMSKIQISNNRWSCKHEWNKGCAFFSTTESSPRSLQLLYQSWSQSRTW